MNIYLLCECAVYFHVHTQGFQLSNHQPALYLLRRLTNEIIKIGDYCPINFTYFQSITETEHCCVFCGRCLNSFSIICLHLHIMYVETRIIHILAVFSYTYKFREVNTVTKFYMSTSSSNSNKTDFVILDFN